MKIYYYLFTPKGEVTKDIITARKNKYSFAIDPYTIYGGYEHTCSSKLGRESENKILGATSTASNGCYMYSTSISEITEDMRLFAVERAEKIQEIIRIEKETRKIGENFSHKLNEPMESEGENESKN